MVALKGRQCSVAQEDQAGSRNRNCSEDTGRGKGHYLHALTPSQVCNTDGSCSIYRRRIASRAAAGQLQLLAANCPAAAFCDLFITAHASIKPATRSLTQAAIHSFNNPWCTLPMPSSNNPAAPATALPMPSSLSTHLDDAGHADCQRHRQ
jgi:hypothetical protein